MLPVGVEIPRSTVAAGASPPSATSPASLVPAELSLPPLVVAASPRPVAAASAGVVAAPSAGVVAAPSSALPASTVSAVHAHPAKVPAEVHVLPPLCPFMHAQGTLRPGTHLAS